MGVHTIDYSKAKGQFSQFKDKPYRPGQEEAIHTITDNGRKVTVICAPTGSGKSVIGMVAGSLHARACYLCSTKQLQHQLVHDFPEARYMVGRSNFKCNADPNRTADLCIHTKATPCEFKPACDYEVHKREVLAHPLQILNYHYILNEANWVGTFSGYPLIICDEADVLEGLLTGFIELRLSRTRLNTLGLNPPRYRTSSAKNGLVSWKTWAQEEGRVKVTSRLQELAEQTATLRPHDAFTEDDMQAVREMRALEALYSRLNIFSTHMDDSWIFHEHNENGHVGAWVFQPTWLTPELAQEYFWKHGERFVLMSATFPPKVILADMLGVRVGDIEYLELPSTFPVSNRPVYLNPVADMSYKSFESELPKLLHEIERILAKHPHEKGLIHAVSWRLTNEIMAELQDSRLIGHSDTSKDQQLAKFMRSKDGVFVSPSSTRGVDLPDDACRFIIIAKAPFQSLGDKLVSSRVYGSGMGAFWYKAICAQDIVQASGRGVRHKDDYCTTYLLDTQIEKLIVDSQGLFPRYWIEAVDYL